MRPISPKKDIVILPSFQHAPWIKAEYKSGGLEGQKIAIVGYSHWNGDLDGEDSEMFTCNVVNDCIDEALPRTAFFTSIRNYFGSESHAGFWPKVMFFNYLPRYIGGPNERFAKGTPAEHFEAKERFFRLAEQYRPNKIIVFTKKAWFCPELPKFDRALDEFNKVGIERAVLPNTCGSYRVGHHVFKAFGFRHPQGAPKSQMSIAVRRAMDFNK